jgi:L-alanine-DL-glutamate epimerase-like enolase superfamily enzyme
MKITDIKTEKIKLELKEPFVTAASSRTFQYTVLVKVETDEGLAGYGEASPTRHVTGETADSVAAVIGEFKEELAGLNPLAVEAAHDIMDRHITGNTSAKAGVDIALYDIIGKAMGVPLYQVLGGRVNEVETDVTISIQKPYVMAEAAKREAAKGFRILKLKIGLDPAGDVGGIKLVRQAVGDRIILKADANQGYSVADAINVLNEIKKFGVVSVEQPRPRADIDGMAYIREMTGLSIVADEAVFSPEDALAFIKKGACDMVNIKLMKTGGIFKAEAVNKICEAAGMPCMVGCMVESRVAIAAGAHFAAAKKNVTDADLDGFILTKELPFVSGGFTAKNGLITLLDKPGLGIEADF